MKKLFLITAFFVLLHFETAFAAPKKEEVKVLEKVKIDSIDELNSHLQELKNEQEPFSPEEIRKIDIESLGLDKLEEPVNKEDVANVKEEIKEQSESLNENSQQISDIQNFVKKEEEREKKLKEVEKKEQERLSKIEALRAKITKQIEVVKEKVVEPVIEALPIEKEVEVEKKIVQKPQNKIVKKEVDEKENARIKEKEKRLNEFRKKYLIHLSQEKDGFIGDFKAYGIVNTKEKNLSWPYRFIAKEEPAPPILSPSRGAENGHIPFVMSAKDKIDAMFDAIVNRDIAAFNGAYSNVINPNTTNKDGDTILTFAILLQNYQVMTSILNKGADPDLPNALGHSPLDIAIAMNDLKSMQILLDMNANINYIDSHGSTYLIMAVKTGYLPMVQALVEAGIDVNSVDFQGNSALNIANRNRKEIIAIYLKKNGAKSYENGLISR
jgi:hypothetical protein